MYLGKSTSTFNSEIVSHRIKVLKTGVHKASVPEYEWLCGGPWRIQAMRGATGVVAVEHIGGLFWQMAAATSVREFAQAYTLQELYKAFFIQEILIEETFKIIPG
ncbi:hypothetical protein NC652_033222 [Populus alba x Populus x berolinensis]|uniref:Uncharacterized protein n=3 Tax=Populus TaxID=3689 RepID=A0A4U5QTA6_POPAL|nr:hypothetical protein NC651_032205 [Populus alba x Populus x berolinensis]KAJ6879831.1 hypothetical protein NC652_033222 [Populus alba x Populus x berolinensis]KAJ6972787.1 hypothetical protein NC653_033182 [Populus alba x Populus x berolinensis]TKS14272.1 hypothetical protein D5086_0000043460 [Populus alba]